MQYIAVTIVLFYCIVLPYCIVFLYNVCLLPYVGIDGEGEEEEGPFFLGRGPINAPTYVRTACVYVCLPNLPHKKVLYRTMNALYVCTGTKRIQTPL